ncbi:MAG TPA: HAMP domain-containing sensor histidine kinase [Pyrinomonadaceae bacterium]
MSGTLHSFGKLFANARQQDDNLSRRKLVLHALLLATFGFLLLSITILLTTFIITKNELFLTRILPISVAAAAVGISYILSRTGHYYAAACGLLGMYGLLATGSAIRWSISLPMSILLFAVIIVLAGMLLGAKHSLYTMTLSILIILWIQTGTAHGTLHPDTAWRQQASSFKDIIGYTLIFSMLGVTSWLFNKQTDLALHQALRAEAALERQKKLLETKVEARTRELQAAQMEKMQQLYQFAQLGQFSTSLMHDLANHITTLSLDIEGMEKGSQTKLLGRAKRQVEYIDNMVHWAYNHLNGKVEESKFDVAREVQEVIKILRHRAQLAHVQVSRVTPQGKHSIMLYGDSNRFRQIMANLISNAIDAYDNATTDPREVIVTITKKDGMIMLTVEDHGRGIPQERQAAIFQPFYSTKNTGMGIGLFIVRQIVEDHFRGEVKLHSKPKETIFTVTLPASGSHE